MKDFTWNPMYNYLIKHWNKINKNKLFKEQFKDENIIINEYFNEYDDHLILVHYNIFSKDLYNNVNSIYREARSLVVDLNTEEIVLCPFKKFFNINELPETNLKLIQDLIKKADLVEFSEKLDGSMQQARWYKNHLVLAGATALNKEMSYQLKEGYDLFKDNFIQLCKDNEDYTFIFEALLEDDRHVVNYNDNYLYLIGARNVYTGKTLSYEEIKFLGLDYNIDTPVISRITLETCLETQSLYTATEKEGWVIFIRVNDKEYRYKLKCDQYVQVHKIINNINNFKIIKQAIENNTIDDLLSKLPESYQILLQEKVNKIRLYCLKMTQIINQYYQSIPSINDDKEFASFVKEYVSPDYHKFMFMKRKNKEINLLKFIHTEDELDQFLSKISIYRLRLN